MKSVPVFRTAISAIAMLACATAHAQLLKPDAQRFSFQAKLTGVADGTHTLHITLYDDNGNQLGSPIDVPEAEVRNGILSEQVPLPDPAVFDEGDRLWAEVSVDADPPLSPRIPLIAVPYSFRVHRVGSVELDDDLVLGGAAAAGSLQLYDDQGAVVITLLGNGDPAVDVAGTVRMGGVVVDEPTEPGFVLTSDSWGQGTWQSLPPTSGYWTANGGDIYNNNAGNVGIGTNSPLYPLHVTADGGWTLYSANTAQSGSSVGVYAVSDSADGSGAFGWATATSGENSGVWGMTNSVDGRGVFGNASNAAGQTYGVYGRSRSPDGTGVFGLHDATTGVPPGVHGVTHSTSSNAAGVLGEVNSTTPGSYSAGVRGINNGTGSMGIGVWGSQDGFGWGVYGTSLSGIGVRGVASAISGTNYGVYGLTDSADGMGVYGRATTASGTNYAVAGWTSSPDGYAGYFVGGRNYFEGAVGIGTQSPSRQLEIQSTQAIVRMASTDHVSGSVLELKNNAVDPTHLGAINFVDGNDGTPGQIGYRATDNALTFNTNFAERVRIDANGYVGIGTANPTEMLHVVGGDIITTGGTIAAEGGDIVAADGGSLKVSGGGVVDVMNSIGNAVIRLDPNTRITTTPILEITGGSDLAESFDVAGENVQPGRVVVIDADNPGGLALSTRAYDRKVAGIISGAGGIQPGMVMAQSGSVADGEHQIALTGRVYCWCDASSGPIEPGDLLTTSDTSGHAMRVTDYTAAQGAIIGKAMTALHEGKGLVLVLVSLQ